MNKNQPVSMAILLALLALMLSPLGRMLEQNIISHVLLQLPLLIVVGIILGKLLEDKLKILQKVNDGGILGILLVIFTGLCWMLPRALDASVTEPDMAMVKYLSLPLLFGLPLVLSWPKLHFVAKGLVKIELLAMLLRLGWLYLVAPVRLCNVYGLKEQILLGKGLLIVAVILSLYWATKLFFRSSQQEPTSTLGLRNQPV